MDCCGVLPSEDKILEDIHIISSPVGIPSDQSKGTGLEYDPPVGALGTVLLLLNTILLKEAFGEIPSSPSSPGFPGTPVIQIGPCQVPSILPPLFFENTAEAIQVNLSLLYVISVDHPEGQFFKSPDV